MAMQARAWHHAIGEQLLPDYLVMQSQVVLGPNQLTKTIQPKCTRKRKAERITSKIVRPKPITTPAVEKSLTIWSCCNWTVTTKKKDNVRAMLGFPAKLSATHSEQTRRLAGPSTVCCNPRCWSIQGILIHNSWIQLGAWCTVSQFHQSIPCTKGVFAHFCAASFNHRKARDQSMTPRMGFWKYW